MHPFVTVQQGTPHIFFYELCRYSAVQLAYVQYLFLCTIDIPFKRSHSTWAPQHMGPTAHGPHSTWAPQHVGLTAHGPHSTWAPQHMGPLVIGVLFEFTVPLTPLSTCKHCHWHRWWVLSIVIDITDHKYPISHSNISANSNPLSKRL
jgi:hypothetical protein